MLGNNNKKCSICRKIKPIKHFALSSNVCLACQAEEDDDEGSSGGGKKAQHNRDAKNLGKIMELDHMSATQRNSTYLKELDKILLKLAKYTKHEKNAQQLQRELLDVKEQEKSEKNDKTQHSHDTENIKIKRNRNTHLFSVTRNAALNLRAQNTARENRPPTKKNASSFYQKGAIDEESLKNEVEKLVAALHEVKNIFKR